MFLRILGSYQIIVYLCFDNLYIYGFFFAKCDIGFYVIFKMKILFENLERYIIKSSNRIKCDCGDELQYMLELKCDCGDELHLSLAHQLNSHT